MEVVWLIVGFVIVIWNRRIMVTIESEMIEKVFDFVLVGWEERKESVAMVSWREIDSRR